MARIATGVLVNALIRRAEGAGGSAMVLARGDATAGAVLLLLVDRGANPRFVERGLGPDGNPALIASGPRSPQPGAPYTYVTTKNFLSQFGLDTLRQLPDFEALEDAGLLSKEKLLAGDIPVGLAGGEDDGEEEVEDDVEDELP